MGLSRDFESQKLELLRAARTPPVHTNRSAPAPVLRYREAAGGEPIRAALIQQRGALRTAPGAPWMPFRSEQVYSMDPPGFAWLAHARAASLVNVVAKDSFIGGAGNMHIRLFDLFTLADARGTEIDQGAALRYWGEILAFPEVVLGPNLQWESLDEQRARFTVIGSSPSVTAVAEFDAQGFVTATHADRYRDVGGTRVLTPWSGHMRDWKLIDGRRFPATWESVWHLDRGDFAAVKMEILSVRTES